MLLQSCWRGLPYHLSQLLLNREAAMNTKVPAAITIGAIRGLSRTVVWSSTTARAVPLLSSLLVLGTLSGTTTQRLVHGTPTTLNSETSNNNNNSTTATAPPPTPLSNHGQQPNRLSVYVGRMKETCPDVMQAYARCVLRHSEDDNQDNTNKNDTKDNPALHHRACQDEFRLVQQCFQTVRTQVRREQQQQQQGM